MSNMEGQASLESEFNKQESTNTEKFVMTEPLKRCSKCGEMKPKSEFYKRNMHLISICKKCNNKRTGDWYIDNLDKSKEQKKEYYNEHKEASLEYGFLFGKNIKQHRLSGFFWGTGVCLICGESHPRFIENHHLVPWEDELVISLCSNHHRMFKTNSRYNHMIAVLNAIENSKFLWDSDGQPKGLKPVLMWTADLSLKGAIDILKSYDLPGYEPIGVEV